MQALLMDRKDTAKEQLEYLIDSNALSFLVSDPGMQEAKELKVSVVEVYRHYYSGSMMLVVEIKASVGIKFFARFNLDDAGWSYTRLAKAVDQVFQNRYSIASYLYDPEKFMEEVEEWENWGGGWSWHESKHPKQPPRFRIGLNSGSISLKYSWHGDRSPYTVAEISSQQKGFV